jgi:hypothetical protein
VIGYKVPEHIRQHQDQLMMLVLKIAKEQSLCLAGNKVMLFTADEEDTLNESVNFKLVDVDEQ